VKYPTAKVGVKTKQRTMARKSVSAAALKVAVHLPSAVPTRAERQRSGLNAAFCDLPRVNLYQRPTDRPTDAVIDEESPWKLLRL